MNEFEIVNFFSLCVIDISKLSGINLREFLELRGLPEYYLIISPTDTIERLIECMSENYKIKAVGKNFYIASQIGSEDYYIPEAGYALVKIEEQIGLIINIRDTRVLYINLEGCNFVERQNIYRIIERIYITQYKIKIICLQSQDINNSLSLKNWRYHPLDRKEYCLNYNIIFHSLVNNNIKIFKNGTEIFTQDCNTQDGNIGIEIHIPYISEELLNYLKRCLEVDFSHNS